MSRAVHVLRQFVLPAAFAMLVIALFIPACAPEVAEYKIGVLLDLTGPNSLDSKEVLEWMASDLNAHGGIGGKPLRLVYKDSHVQDAQSAAQELVDDPAIRVVIGPQMSDEVFKIAPIFEKSRKLLISPTATSAEIMRAFAKSDCVWRTCQSDVAQVRSILDELSLRKVKRIALVYPEDSYGSTFYQWTGFFCTELGIELMNVVGYGPTTDRAKAIDEAASGSPEYILAVALSNDAAAFKHRLDETGSASRLFLSDSAETGYLLEALGDAAEGLELMSPAADPDSGFEEAYRARFGYYPYDYAASTCDAFLLAAYAIARQEARGRPGDEDIARSFKRVVSGTGKAYGWDKAAEAVTAILAGEFPNLKGASSPLKFDVENGVDPTESYYSLNRVEKIEGKIDFRTVSRFSSTRSSGIGRLAEGSSSVLTKASESARDLDTTSSGYSPGPRRDLWAVILSTSDGWDNYRHQSDALAVYAMLKANGLPDERIILFSIDDVPWLALNPEPGDIHHEPKGANLRGSASIDYAGDKVTEQNFTRAMLGEKSEKTPIVLESDAGSDLFVYLVGHGDKGSIGFANGESLSAREFARLARDMSAKGKFRRAFFMVETCFGESLGAKLDVPGCIFFTGAARMEASFGATYDRDIRQWLADDFTARALEAMEKPGMTIDRLYLDTYERVTGSHVRLLNYRAFGDIEAPIREFIFP